MTTENRKFLTLWGKTDRSHPGSMNYHPLLFHLYDVAYCARKLWEALPPGIKTRMAKALSMDEERAGTLFVLLAGLHDLGKAYPNFQNKAAQFLPALQAPNVGFDFPDDIGKPHPHNFVSVPEAIRVLTGTGIFSQPLEPELAELLSYVLGAHHGIFPHSGNLTDIAGRTLGVNPEWRQSRDWLAAQLKESIPNVESAFPAPDSAVTDFAFAPLLAALISVADWFGSSKYFEMRGPLDILDYRKIILDYRKTSEESAAVALEKSGWKSPPDKPDTASDFAQIFAYLSSDPQNPIEPNALQTKVAKLLPEVQSPALWLIEEEMGVGKTEAAFSIFDYLRVEGRTHGIYIAMPTQATSNAMHDRLGKFLEKRNPGEGVNLILAHSHATLDPGYLARMEVAKNFNGPVYNEETDAEEGALLVQEWFTHNKQALLAHYGVGTIDQALLGVLQAQHWFVRLLGLAGKVVVFDEVHAYDAYMNTLLARLIEWLAELDCTVVLLSATLPKKTRLELAEAYAKGAKTELEKPENAEVNYPRTTLTMKGKPESARAYPIEKSPEEIEKGLKTVKLRHLPNTPEAVKTALLEAISGDGCAIVVCNTVGNAQAMYDALKAELAPEWDCLLFHARTPFVWRKAKEEDVLKRFGKGSEEDRKKPRGRTLLVATQVVEQSLDLDADFMASELAPVDLILQRMGRLWRHVRARNTSAPRFALLCDTDAETGLPVFGKSEFVYALHTLLRSWLELKGKSEIILPTDIELLVKAAYDAPDPTDLPEAWTALLAAARTEMEDERKKQRKHAKAVSVRMQEEDATFSDWIESLSPALLDEDDPEIHKTLRAMTRDGDPSLTVVLCGTGENGELLVPDTIGYITPETAQKMMGFSLPTSNQGIYKALKSELPPANWQKNAHLKHCRRIIFENGAATLPNLRLTLTEEKGLEIETSGEA